MKTFKNLLFENQDGIGILTMNRPAALNALNAETVGELGEALCEIGKDTAVKVLILTGAERAFVAGADIKEMLPMTAAEGQAWCQMAQSVFNQL
jgi:enoyl-CoA hydratase